MIRSIRTIQPWPMSVSLTPTPQAREHFLGVKSFRSDIHGICLLDPDKDPDALQNTIERLKEKDLEYAVWSRRHLESYLLVPEAIGRAIAGPDAALLVPQITAAFRDFLKNPPHALLFPDKIADYRTLEINWMRDFHAKQIVFSPDPSDKSFVTSQEFPETTPQHVAQVMLPSEIHNDVVKLIDRLFSFAETACSK